MSLLSLKDVVQQSFQPLLNLRKSYIINHINILYQFQTSRDKSKPKLSAELAI